MENVRIASISATSSVNVEKECDRSDKRKKSRFSNNTNTMFVNPFVMSSSETCAIQNRSRYNENNGRNVNDIRLNPAAVGVPSKSVINTKQITETIAINAINLIFRTEQRISLEKRIIADLERFVKDKKFDLKVMPIGSATYGFGGYNTDINICLLNNDGDSSQNHINNLFESFVKSFEESTHFKISNRIVHRGVKNRLDTIHNATRTSCTLQIDVNANKIESSQIIRNCLLHSSVCYHLIGFIRAWQDCLIQAAAQNGTTAFQFNTYIISVLVIFFYQNNRKFPKVANVPSIDAKFIDNVPHVNANEFKRAVGAFFQFYGKIYDINFNIISINIGRWEDRYLIQSQQVNLSPEQQSLRDGIKSKPSNWQNCSMFVQDIKSPEINITADIANKEAKHFKEMCRLFESDDSIETAIDEYLMKVQHKLCAASVIDLTVDLDTSEPPPAKRAALGNHEPGSAHVLTTVVMSQKNQIFADIPAIAMESLTRTERRNLDERKILAYLMSTCFENVRAKQFGSSTYGFGGSDTDFNILVDTDGSTIRMTQISQKLSKSFERSAFQSHFELLDKMNGTRVLTKRYKLFHKASNIICWVHLDLQNEMSETSQTIRNCIVQAPICYHLIAYVKSWQEALNRVAILKEMHAFQFNTYIISVLVIFYLQLKQNFPKLANVQVFQETTIDHIPSVAKDLLKRSIREFFEFYGNFYKMKDHLISVRIGQWEDYRLEIGEVIDSPEQKRLRESMSLYWRNWRNCSMYVEDLNAAGVNIAADIPEDQAKNFKEMCQLFASMNEHEHDRVVDEYLLKYSQIRLVNTATASAAKNASKNLISANNSNDTAGHSTQNLQKDSPIIRELLSSNQNVCLIEQEMTIPQEPSDLQVRTKFELEIFTILVQFITDLDPTMKLFPFGSTQYGVPSLYANFNLLITTGQKNRPDQVNHWFIFKSEKSNIDKHFMDLKQIKGNRVMNSQISMIHKESGIQCIIAFDHDDTIVQSVEILKRFTSDPLCNYLIKAVRSNIEKSGGNYFNTYIISILVIFFLQVKHRYPTADRCLFITSTDSDYKPILRKFFKFYSSNLWAQTVISIHIGQWQELQANQIKKNKPNKLRLRMGIEKSPQNWQNCSMYVQDLVRHDVNATVEISKEAADAFRNLCKKLHNTC